MLCPKCKNNGLVIEQAPDSRFKIVKCYSCPYWGWLKNFNKKTTEFNTAATALALSKLVSFITFSVFDGDIGVSEKKAVRYVLGE